MKVIKILNPDNPKHSYSKSGKKVDELFGSAAEKLNIKLSELLNSDFKQDDTDIKDDNERDIEQKCYKKVTIDQFINILNPMHIWAIYVFKNEHFADKIRKQSYEDHVCGFLQYYDRETRNGMSDHSIYFHWGKWGDHSNCVVIFLDPPPARTARNRPPLYERINYETNDYYDIYREDIDIYKDIPLSPSGQISDPPKPGGPPPPR